MKAMSSYLLASGRRVAHALRLRGPLAADPTAQMLHGLLLIVAAWIIIALLVTGTLVSWPARRVINITTVQAGLLGALTLIRLGYFRAASLVYLTSTWIFATLAASSMGGIRSPIIILYGTLSVSAAWLLGYAAALRTACACIGTMLVFAILDTIGIRSPNTTPGTAIGMWFIAVQATLIGTIPVAHVIRTLLDTLKELQGYKEHLEQLVEERTGELVHARDEAQAASRAKSAFLATVSHELRSPLNTILLLSDPMCIDANTSDACREDLQLIQRSGTHLLHLINDVLDSARIEAGQIVVENVPFELRELVREVTDPMQVRAEEKSLDLRVEEIPESPHFVQADRAKLRHVLINLVDNAIKYTDHGKVTLRCEAKPADSTNRLLIRFEIADTGIGIAPQDQARIFEPFTRLGNVAARRGTGLGLSITRQYVNAIGGNIRVESALGEGSRFCVDVPADIIAQGDYAKTEMPRITGIAPGQPDYRVLIIEDQPEDRLVLRRLLEEVGFRVRVAETGESGVEIFQAWRPHFIWMDRRLPLMDGLEATRRIRSLDGGRDVRIVGVSASVFASERDEMLAAGLDDFVRKPYLPNEILDCMMRLLGVRYCWGNKAPAAG